MSEYNWIEIEEKWRKLWDKDNTFKTCEPPKNKYYVLVMFAYPSGDIHMGHFRNYTIGDVVARYRMLKGYDVLHPFGWDAFGLPAEQAAIKYGAGLSPRDWTMNNINTSRDTLKKMGICYDWSREVLTCNPDYYKWAQWLFLVLFKKGLAYQAKSEINFCETCNSVLADEQAQGGVCWRCNTQVIKKKLDRCWFLRYTSYAERLLKDIDRLQEWPENVKIMQRNWIGRSEGVEIDFKLDSGENFTVFTTRPDTLYGVTFVTFAPEQPLAISLACGTQYENDVAKYIENALKKSEIERTSTGEKDGVFTGRYAINPISQERVPIFIADYVIATYGTGAVMGVPAHDQRDFLFAKRYNLPIKVVIQPDAPLDPSKMTRAFEIDDPIKYLLRQSTTLDPASMTQAYEDEGIMVNSGQFSGLPSKDGIKRIQEFISHKGLGRLKVNYRLKDWLISRQRYWGCPIPIIHCDKCGPLSINENNLPVLLPEGPVDLLPKGRSPLSDLKQYIGCKCPQCGRDASRDPDTMDTFIDSSFYLFRYLDPKNEKQPWGQEKAKAWLPVDVYIGGVEHACGHLLYFRFITKVLHDAGFLPVDEPVIKLFNHGMVLDEKGEVMSKSKGNVVSPRDLMEKHGVDILRVAMLFAAPSDAEIRCSDKGIIGAERFLKRLYGILINFVVQSAGYKTAQINESELSTGFKELRKRMHQIIKKAQDSMDGDFCFNTTIAKIMELLNFIDEAQLKPSNASEGYLMHQATKELILVISPFTPFLAEELWQKLGQKNSLFKHASWPVYDPVMAKEEVVEIPIQINGKLRGRIKVQVDTPEDKLKELALSQEPIKRALAGRKPSRVIIVTNRLVNIVT